MRDFEIGLSNQSASEFLQKEGKRASYFITWDKVPAGSLPVILLTNAISRIGIIAHCKEKLEEFSDDPRQKTMFLVEIEKLINVAGDGFIDYISANNLADDEAIQKAKEKEKENLSQSANMLFEGEPEPLGGLSNEAALTRACPKEFQRDNPWSDYAMQLFYSGGNIQNWKWKSKDQETTRKQRSCFSGLLGTFGIKHEDKGAVAGWMLSEMLEEVPEYVESQQ